MAKTDNKEQRVTDLIERNGSRIMMIIQGYCSSREDLEDLFQEICIRVWNNIDYFRGDSSEETWIYRIAVNTALNFVRSSSKKIKTVPLLDIDLTDYNDSSSSAIKRLYELIRRLDMVDRALVMLWLENLRYDEIGLIMGISAKNVSVRLVRIKEKLKDFSKNI